MPRTRGHRVAVIGAGPAGATVAYHLARRGAEPTVFESSPRVGGQTRTIGIHGTRIELGACYMHLGYRHTKALARAVGMGSFSLPPASFVGPAPASSWRQRGRLARYVGLWCRYTALGLAPELAMQPFSVFLQRHGLGALAVDPLFAIAFEAQGYGPADAISARAGLAWVTPALLATPLLAKLRPTWGLQMLDEGFTPFIEALLGGVDVRRNARVRRVEPVLGGVEVMAMNGEVEQFERAVVCTLPFAVEHPASPTCRREHFDRTLLYSASLSASEPIPLAMVHRAYFTDQMQGGHAPINTIRYDGFHEGRHIYAASGYLGALSEAEIHERLHAGLRNDAPGWVYTVDRALPWEYNWRLNASGVAAGVEGALTQLREVGLAFVSGALGHWNVESIARMAEREVDRLLQRDRLG